MNATSNDIERLFGQEDPAILLDGRAVEDIAEEYCDGFEGMFGEAATEEDRDLALEILRGIDGPRTPGCPECNL